MALTAIGTASYWRYKNYDAARDLGLKEEPAAAATAAAAAVADESDDEVGDAPAPLSRTKRLFNYLNEPLKSPELKCFTKGKGFAITFFGVVETLGAIAAVFFGSYAIHKAVLLKDLHAKLIIALGGSNLLIPLFGSLLTGIDLYQKRK